MTAQRWLYSAITAAFGYVVYLIIAVFDREILLPSQHNSAILGALATVCLVSSLALFINRRFAALREYMDRRFAFLEQRTGLDGPTVPLRVVASVPVAAAGTVVDARARAEVIELSERINRRLTD